MGILRLLLNVIWLVLCGWWMAILYVLAGIIACVLIITIPLGIAAFRIAGYALWPFGRSIEVRREAGLGSLIGNIIWIILFGWWLAVGHLTAGITLCVTIIGIPLGLANFKLIPISLVPLGVRIVPSGRLIRLPLTTRTERVSERYPVRHGRHREHPGPRRHGRR